MCQYDQHLQADVVVLRLDCGLLRKGDVILEGVVHLVPDDLDTLVLETRLALLYAMCVDPQV